MADVSGAALVVGGGSGIGLACAQALRAAGWPVIVADLKPDPQDLDAIAVDVRDPDAVEHAAEVAAQRHAGIGHLLYAAGTARVTPVDRIAPKEWDLVIGVNLTGAHNVLRACVPHMPAGAAATIVSSIDSGHPVAGLAHYAAAKAGCEALVRNAALELGGRGLRVNALLPGVVRTPLMAPMLERPGVEEAFRRQTPLGDIAGGAEIADVAVFLASHQARWITGVSLPVDGGMSLREHPRLLPETETTPA